jgi:hypothetical protein
MRSRRRRIYRVGDRSWLLPQVAYVVLIFVIPNEDLLRQRAKPVHI